MKRRMLPLLALLIGLAACTSTTSKVITSETTTAQSLDYVGAVRSVITTPDDSVELDPATADCCCSGGDHLDHFNQEETFDREGRLLESKYFEHDGQIHQATKASYDDAGRLLETRTSGVEAWMNMSEAYSYDRDGRLIELKIQTSMKPAYSKLYHYNSAGLLDTIRRIGEDTPTNETQIFAYDAKGRCTEEKRFNSEQSLVRHISNEYNELDSVSRSTTKLKSDKMFSSSTYTYNKQGKLEHIHTDHNNGFIVEEHFSYDNNGRLIRHRLTSSSDENRETTYEYGDNGVVKETFVGPYSSYQISYKRDKQGNWIERTRSNLETGDIISRHRRTIEYY